MNGLEAIKKRILSIVMQVSGLELLITTLLAIAFQYVLAMYFVFPLVRSVRGVDLFNIGAGISIYLTLLVWIGLQSVFTGNRTGSNVFTQWGIRMLLIIPFQLFIMYALVFHIDLTPFNSFEVNMMVGFIYIIPLVGASTVSLIIDALKETEKRRI